MRRACGERLQSSTEESDTHSLSAGDRDGFFIISEVDLVILVSTW